ncbi:MAG: elongation factor 1-beta [Candidatus Baldrarchaeia archaeon]
MGKVLTVIKILPESVEVDLKQLLEDIKKNLPENAEFKDSKEEPIAFGLKALRIAVVVPDAEGGTDILEEIIKNVKGVGQVEVEHATRI